MCGRCCTHLMRFGLAVFWLKNIFFLICLHILWKATQVLWLGFSSWKLAGLHRNETHRPCHQNHCNDHTTHFAALSNGILSWPTCWRCTAVVPSMLLWMTMKIVSLSHNEYISAGMCYQNGLCGCLRCILIKFLPENLAPNWRLGWKSVWFMFIRQ